MVLLEQVNRIRLRKYLGNTKDVQWIKKFQKSIYSEPHSIRTVIIQLLSGHTSRQWKNQ